MAMSERRLSQEVREGITKRVMQILFLIVFQAALLLLSSGRLDWPWVWVYLGLYLAGIFTNAALMFRYAPETIARRATTTGFKKWDKIVSGLWAVAGVVQLIVAGLDQRYAWSAPLPPALHLVGIIGFVLGFALFSWAMISNAYFAMVVRVQKDSGHFVCTTGPYRFVRHPGYVGAILESFALPLLLGSVWAFIPGAIGALMMVVRAALEDRTLHVELPGYREYAQKTRYRLLPGVW